MTGDTTGDTVGVTAPAEAPPVLSIDDLHVEFRTPFGIVYAVNGVSFSVQRGETLGILGESGSGKSVTAAAIMGLIPTPPGRVARGRMLFQGRDLLAMAPAARRRIRGTGIAMVFQDAITSLNPRLTVGEQIGEMFVVHRGCGRAEARKRAIELMQRVGIPMAKERIDDYPHQFSGGMCQRVMIAIALALEPELLIADEPTTALDVTIQAQIMDLLRTLQQQTGMGLILITHDLGVMAESADRVAVMYAGAVVETGPRREVFRRPAHPYTLGLMRSVPRLDGKALRLVAIDGSPPVLSKLPPGCAFRPRCAWAEAICADRRPPLSSTGPDRASACHFAEAVRNA
jgi:oligopeptide transport system ATP-binding protein